MRGRSRLVPKPRSRDESSAAAPLRWQFVDASQLFPVGVIVHFMPLHARAEYCYMVPSVPNPPGRPRTPSLPSFNPLHARAGAEEDENARMYAQHGAIGKATNHDRCLPRK